MITENGIEIKDENLVKIADETIDGEALEIFQDVTTDNFFAVDCESGKLHFLEREEVELLLQSPSQDEK